MKQLNVLLDESTEKPLRLLAAELGITRGELVRRAIAKYLDAYEQQPEPEPAKVA